MARGTAAQAGQNAATGQTLSNTYGQAAAGNASILTPTLNRLATNPQGFGQQTINNMNTAALQSAGGAAAGQIGAAQQRAAATNNAGGYQAAMGQAGHDATAQLSDAALGVQNRNAELQQMQQQEGIQGLQNMYGTNVGAGENALGLSTNALNAQTQAQNQTLGSWLGPLQALTAPFQVTKGI